MAGRRRPNTAPKTARSRAPAAPAPMRPWASADRRGVSWREIERAVILRIAHNVYPVGSRLPTCDALAAEFGANKNTVNRAYRALAERGYVSSQAGSGTFVNRRPARPDHRRTIDEVTSLIGLAVQEAKLVGLPAARFRDIVEAVVEEAYAPARPRIGFIECNALDAATLSRDLQAALHHPVEPLLLEEVAGSPEQYWREYEILAVNLAHLAEVEAAMTAAGLSPDPERVFGLHVPIDPDSLTRIARLRKGTRLGIVCDLDQTLVSLTGLASGCNAELAIEGCLSSRRPALRALVKRCDVLLVTPSALDRVKAEDPRVPIITISFRPDERSIARLAEIIGRRKAARPLPASWAQSATG